MNLAEEDRQIALVVDRVRRRYPHLSAHTVADVVGAIRHQFDGRPIRDFVPLFVERRATAALATLGSEIPDGHPRLHEAERSDPDPVRHWHSGPVRHSGAARLD